MIIGLAGYAQSGKSTVANILAEQYGFQRLAFADGIRRCLFALNPVVPTEDGVVRLQDLVTQRGWEDAKVSFPEVRRLLQVFGTEVGRELFDEDVWVQELFKAMGSIGSADYVIADVRFPNEVGAIRSAGGEVWRIVRPFTTGVNNHISETAVEDVSFEKIIVNNSGLDGLARQVQSLIGSRHGV